MFLYDHITAASVLVLIMMSSLGNIVEIEAYFLSSTLAPTTTRAVRRISNNHHYQSWTRWGSTLFPSSSSSAAATVGSSQDDMGGSSSSSSDEGEKDPKEKNPIEVELEQLQYQLELIEALEIRNESQLDSFVDKQDQWDSLEEEERILLQSKPTIEKRMEVLTEELIQLWMGSKSMDG